MFRVLRKTKFIYVIEVQTAFLIKTDAELNFYRVTQNNFVKSLSEVNNCLTSILKILNYCKQNNIYIYIIEIYDCFIFCNYIDWWSYHMDSVLLIEWKNISLNCSNDRNHWDLHRKFWIRVLSWVIFHSVGKFESVFNTVCLFVFKILLITFIIILQGHKIFRYMAVYGWYILRVASGHGKIQSKKELNTSILLKRISFI